MPVTTTQLEGLAGSGHLVTSSGDKVGRIGQIYLDDASGDPAWVTVKTGLFGTSESFVPVQDARVEGSDVVVDYDQETIKAAPRVDPDGSISPEEEHALYSHYRLGTGQAQSTGVQTSGVQTSGVQTSGRSGGQGGWDGTGDVPSDLDDPSEVGDDRPDISDQTVGYDRSGPTTDQAMTRSEERLQVGTERHESGRARLRKHVVTEQVNQTVPVRTERATVEREPITEANYAKSVDGPEITEAVHEVTLHAEKPVVHKEAVPVERVRLDTETVTEQATVTDSVRQERIDTDTDGDSTTRR